MQIQAIEAGHFHIQKHHRWRNVQCVVKKCLCIVKRIHRITQHGQHVAEVKPDVVVVFDQKDVAKSLTHHGIRPEDWIEHKTS